jgi:hypothetical protein
MPILVERNLCARSHMPMGMMSYDCLLGYAFTMNRDADAMDSIPRATAGRVFGVNGQPLLCKIPSRFDPGFQAAELSEAKALRPFMRGQPMVHCT